MVVAMEAAACDFTRLELGKITLDDRSRANPEIRPTWLAVLFDFRAANSVYRFCRD
jgi:hypothetical protein